MDLKESFFKFKYKGKEIIGFEGDISLILNNGVLELPSIATSIGEGVFKNQKKIVEVHTNGITKIGISAFEKCDNLRAIDIPSVKYICDKAFYCCSKLEHVNFSNSLLAIGDRAFCICSSLKRLTLSDNLLSIGCSAFSHSAITKIIIPETVISVGRFAFSDCHNLDRIIICHNDLNDAVCKNKVNGYYSFELPSSLTKNMNNICGRWESQWNRKEAQNKEFDFLNTVYLVTYQYSCNGFIFDSIRYDNGYAVTGYCGNATQITIPSKYSVIEAGAFKDCEKIESVIIPDSTEVRESAFENCQNLRYVEYKPLAKTSEWKKINRIQERTFANCTALQNVILCDSIEHIHEEAFANCKKLKNIVLPAKFKEIAKFSFAGSGLTSILIPKDFWEIEDYAFVYCKNLSKISGYSFEGYHHLGTNWNKRIIVDDWKPQIKNIDEIAKKYFTNDFERIQFETLCNNTSTEYDIEEDIRHIYE